MPKKLRFFTAYLVHYLKKYFVVIILGILFGSFVYVERNQLITVYQNIFVSESEIGVEGIYTVSNIPPEILSQISFGITSVTENNKIVLSPIISNLDIKNNNLSYTFTFKDDLYWQNGKKFKTSDLDIKIPQTTVTVTSPNILTITTQESFSPLLSILNKPLFMKNTLIGLGKYKIKNISYQDGHIKYLQLTSKDKKAKDMIYHFYPNNSDLFNAFKLGEIDEISTISLETQLDGWPKIKIVPSISTSKYLAVFLNTNKINSKQNRQAIAYATPKSTDKNNRCLGPISPNSWAYNPQIKQYNFNPTRSRELYEKGSLDQITLMITDRRLLSQAEAIKKSWEEILGIKVNLSISLGQIDNNYDALLAYSQTTIDPDQYSLWHSTQNNTNITQLNNSRIDKLLEEGRQIQDQLERKKIYNDFQKFLLEESPAIFLEYPTTYTISRLK